MNKSLENQTINLHTRWFPINILAFTVYIFIANVVYTIRKRNSPLFKDNMIGCMSILCSLVHSTFDEVLSIMRTKEAFSDDLLCKVMSIKLPTLSTLSRCFSSTIFLHRFKAINQNNQKVLKARRAYLFTVSIYVLSLVLITFRYINAFFFQIFELCKLGKPDAIEYSEVFRDIGMVCHIFIGMLQSIVLVEIIKPIFRHCLKLNGNTISNR